MGGGGHAFKAEAVDFANQPVEPGVGAGAARHEVSGGLGSQRQVTPLGPEAAAYLVPRSPRSFAGLERLVGEIDRLSLERMAPATQSVWRAALEAVLGPEEPRLL